MPIMLKFYFRKQTDLGIHQRNFFSSKSLKGPACIALLVKSNTGPEGLQRVTTVTSTEQCQSRTENY